MFIPHFLCVLSITILLTVFRLIGLYYGHSFRFLGDAYLRSIITWWSLLIIQIVMYNQYVLVYCLHN